jgi:hypothetical protein
MAAPPEATPLVAADAGPARAWFWAGFVFVAGALAALEIRDPYYFCQDDSLVLELPETLLACRAVWQGVAPEYDPYIFLGSPLLSVGGGLLYPPLYAAYAVARHVLRDEFATFDVFAVGHLLAGYCLSWLMARRLGASGPAAALCGATFAVCGPLVVMGRCWHAFNAMAVFIPGLALLADRLCRGPVGFGWAAATGLALGLFYHAGFPQLFVIGTGLFVLSIAATAALGAMPWRRVAWLAPALALGAAIAVPMVVQQARLSHEMLPMGGGGEGIGGNLAALLLPYPLVEGRLPNNWASGNDHHGGHFYHFGLVGALLFLAAVARIAGDAGRGGLRAVDPPSLVLLLMAIVAGLLSLGPVGGLWLLTRLLPAGFGNNPFRVLPWFVFYAALLGCLDIDRVAARVADRLDAGELPRVGGRAGFTRGVRVAAAVLGAVLLAAHVSCLDVAFYLYGFDPYPPLPPALTAALAEGGRPQHRLLSVAAWRTSDPTYPLALPHDLPAVYGLPSPAGYSPVMQSHRGYVTCMSRLQDAPREGLAAYGVGRVVVHRTLAPAVAPPRSANPFERVYPLSELLPYVDMSREVPIGEAGEFVKVFDVPGAVPLASATGDAARPLPVDLRADGIDVDLEGLPEGGRVLVNALWWPQFAARADGRPVGTAADEWNRTVVEVPAGARRLTVRFEPQWIRGLVPAAVLAGLGGLAAVACARLVDHPAARRLAMVAGLLLAAPAAVADGIVPRSPELTWRRPAREIDPRRYGARGDGLADDTAALQAALDVDDATVVIPPGTYLVSRPLRIGSRRWIAAAPDAVIRLADGAGVAWDSFLLTNADPAGGNHDIDVEGGVWDGNNAGNPRRREYHGRSYGGVVINVTNARRFVLRGLTVRNPESFSIRVGEAEDFVIEDVGFDQSRPRPNQDGVHVGGHSRRGVVRRLRVTSPSGTHDDMVALNADDDVERPFNVGMRCGPIGDILVSDLRADRAYTFVRLLSHEHAISNVLVEDVAGGCTTQAINADRWRFPAGGGCLRDVLVRGMAIRRHGEKRDPLILVQSRVHHVVIRDFERLDDDAIPDGPATMLVDTGGPVRVCTGRPSAPQASARTTADEPYVIRHGDVPYAALDSVASTPGDPTAPPPTTNHSTNAH